MRSALSALGLASATLVAVHVGVGRDAAPASATADPPANVYPNPQFYGTCTNSSYDDSSACANQTLKAIDNARSQEGLPPMELPSDWYSLTPTEQLFVATNLERVVRGLQPLSAMATQLDSAASQAARQGSDPSPPAGFPAGSWGGNWGGAVGNALEDVYLWMYYDGPGANNAGCPRSGGAGCWVHRHNILMAMQCQPCVLGGGFSPTGWQPHPGTYEPSWDDLLVDSSGSPAVDYSWSQVTPYLPGTEDYPSSSSRGAAAATAPGADGASCPGGYRMDGADGGVFDFGRATYAGSLPGMGVRVGDIVGMAPTSSGRGYWLVGSDGGVFAFGDAAFLGSLPGMGVRVNDIVAMAPTRSGRGYWLVGSDGGVFAFGDAGFHGSVPARGQQVHDVVGLAPAAGGGGYWVADRYGDLWTFGEAPALGSPADSRIPVDDIVGISAAPGGAGYWLVGSDGGVFNYGSSPFKGSLPGMGIQVDDVEAMAPSADGAGYWLFGSDGGVFAFGDAPFCGSLPGTGVQVDDVRSGGGL